MLMFINLFNIGEASFWINLLICLPGILIGLSFHEFAHAFAAYKMGDNTARNMGRMTVNPFAHLDLFGFLSLLFLGFGWAKPVPVNSRNFKGNIRVADIIVSLAGIVMNFLLAMLFMFLYYLLNITFGINHAVVNSLIISAVSINLSLMVFNLIPIPPLDGSHILEDLLIKRIGPKPFMLMRQYSMYMLIVLLLILNMTNVLSTVINFVFSGINGFWAFIFGLI